MSLSKHRNLGLLCQALAEGSLRSGLRGLGEGGVIRPAPHGNFSIPVTVHPVGPAHADLPAPTQSPARLSVTGNLRISAFLDDRKKVERRRTSGDV